MVNDVKELLFKLVSISSINYTQGENRIAEFIYQYLVNFKNQVKLEDSFEVFFQEIKEDVLRRKNVIAILKGKLNESNKAIVFLGHFDTVDIEDYGRIKDLAFDPVNLKNKFREIYPEIVNEDVEFGRGIFDMKGGIVVNLQVLKDLVINIEKWGGIVIFLFVCDEEGDSKGMLSAIRFLSDFKRKNNIEYLFCVDTDYTVDKAIYLGSIGKVLIGILVRGLETHVGQSLEGLNSNYILANIVSKIDDNIELVEFVNNRYTPPSVVMKMKDLRESYNVKTNLYSFAYVNHLFFEDSLEKILIKYKNLVENVLREIVLKKQQLLNKMVIDFKLPSVPVYTLNDLVSKFGSFQYKSFGSNDYREDIVLSLKELTESILDHPFVLIFLLPPYYPSVRSDNYLKKELIDYLNLGNIKDLRVLDYYPYISDLSFLGSSEDEEFLKRNMLGWGRYFYFDIDVIKQVSMPCINWGVWGKDAHKFTERIFVNYSLYELPRYLSGFVYRFFR